MSSDNALYWQEWILKNRSKLASLLRTAFPWMEQATVDDWLQHTITLALEGQWDPASMSLRLIWKIIFHDVLDWLRRRERESLTAFGSSSSGDWQPPDMRHPEPHSAVLRREKETRREKLVSDVLRDFTRDSERRGAAREQEIMERSLRGQSREQIAEATGMTMNNVYVTLSRARGRLMEHVSRKDVNQTVFTTFHGEASKHGSLVELIRWTIEVAGAMCPGDDRIAAFFKAGDADRQTMNDLWFHIVEARCPLCLAAEKISLEAT